jgi:predicted nucleic acid-binding protein
MLLRARHLRMVALSPAIAAEAARVRADFQMKTPDAIQLATAKEGGATSFVTNAL